MPKNIPDSYEVYLFYWENNAWVFADKAVGWIQTDVTSQCDPGHCPFSPNEYTWPNVILAGDDYRWVKQAFWYFDNSYYGDTVGSQRLARLQQFTNNPLNVGKFQFEYRRVDANGNNLEGWDAKYEDWTQGWCIPTDYGTDTNLPLTRGTSHEESEWICGIPPGDEEAEVWTQGTESMQVYVGQDPTNVHLIEDPPIYYVNIKFYRRPAQRGQNFVLQTEFEMVDGIAIDRFFDIVVPTKYINETF